MWDLNLQPGDQELNAVLTESASPTLLISDKKIIIHSFLAWQKKENVNKRLLPFIFLRVGENYIGSE